MSNPPTKNCKNISLGTGALNQFGQQIQYNRHVKGSSSLDSLMDAECRLIRGNNCSCIVSVVTVSAFVFIVSSFIEARHRLGFSRLLTSHFFQTHIYSLNTRVFVELHFRSALSKRRCRQAQKLRGFRRNGDWLDFISSVNNQVCLRQMDFILEMLMTVDHLCTLF